MASEIDVSCPRVGETIKQTSTVRGEDKTSERGGSERSPSSASNVSEATVRDEIGRPHEERADDSDVKKDADVASSQPSSNELQVSDTKGKVTDCQKLEATGGSIYLDSDGHKKQQKEDVKARRRPTKAQLAAMDALASFGGSDLGSVVIKKRDLKEELKVEAEQLKSQDDVPQESAKQPRTRLQAARQEADAVFRHIPLGEGVKKVPFGFRKKRGRDEDEGREMKKLSRLDKAKAEALEAFGGAPLESVAKKQKRDHYQVPEKQIDSSQPSTVRLSRLARARAEALHSFGGGSLGDVMDTAKKRVAKTLEVKQKEENCSDADKIQELEHNDKENLINSVSQS